MLIRIGILRSQRIVLPRFIDGLGLCVFPRCYYTVCIDKLKPSVTETVRPSRVLTVVDGDDGRCQLNIRRSARGGALRPGSVLERTSAPLLRWTKPRRWSGFAVQASIT